MYDAGLHVRTLHTLHHPTALAFVQPGGNSPLTNSAHVLLVAESNQVRLDRSPSL